MADFSVSPNDVHELSPAIRTHLSRVHLTMAFFHLASAFGAYLKFQIIWNIFGGCCSMLGYVVSGIGMIFSLLGVAVCMYWFWNAGANEKAKRLSILFLSALLQGVAISLFIEIFFDYDPRILIVAYLGNVVMFVCFSATSKLARSIVGLYFGGLVSSLLSIIVLLDSSTFTGGALSISEIKMGLLMGLTVMLAYILLKIPTLINNALVGDMDFVLQSHGFYSLPSFRGDMDFVLQSHGFYSLPSSRIMRRIWSDEF